jgi:hypothetical protein
LQAAQAEKSVVIADFRLPIANLKKFNWAKLAIGNRQLEMNKPKG